MRHGRIVKNSVHPHACGEHLFKLRCELCPLGSSPRMWGTPMPSPEATVRARFIPTHVGNTTAGWPPSFAISVHPHACGEHAPLFVISIRPAGSSPRMWGTQRPGWNVLAAHRFIPTHVGNTRRTAARGRENAVHPHACGEHRQIRIPPFPRSGSSPRMWGTRRPSLDRAPRHRFIPTHVGNTRLSAVST